jgi:hypothetical protein
MRRKWLSNRPGKRITRCNVSGESIEELKAKLINAGHLITGTEEMIYICI